MTTQDESEQIRLAKQKIAILEKQAELQFGLPHLHGMAWYDWAWDFFQSTNPQCFLCAANQISKSSTQIRKCIDWATDVKRWPKLWRRRPLQFWYLYPAKPVATAEFEKKWIPEWMPRGAYKNHPHYGWKAVYKNKEISHVNFNNGVTVFFKTYGQDAADLQTGSVDAIFCDEELPVELYDELNLRLAATDGYFHMVFTATLGQEFWRETIEVSGKEERFKGAWKRQVSMYDCLKYMDGSPSHWSEKKIERIKNSCQSEAEIQRRVYGRFVVDQGLKYPGFERARNVKAPPDDIPYLIPNDWQVYAAVDIGSGGEEGHPAAIVFVGVSPDFRKGRVFKGWRGDGVQTTAADIFLKYLELRGKQVVTLQAYDWASKDFHTIASRNGEPFVPADKGHDTGEQIVNVLFKNGILTIDDIAELRPLVQELVTLQIDTPKNKAKDDFADALRYALTRIPWDWSVISGLPIEAEKSDDDQDLNDRSNWTSIRQLEETLSDGIEEELEGWNELYDA